MLDCESKWITDGPKTTHTFRLAVAAWWDHNTKRNAEPTYARISTVSSLWEWVSEHCEREGRTIAYAHNVGFDLQVSQMWNALPALGWALSFFTLERDNTMVTWRRGSQSLVLVDSLSILPAALAKIAVLIGDAKDELPDNDADDEVWFRRCEGDVRVLAGAIREFNTWARDFDVGNWRASGSGLAWSLWRHKFLDVKILASSGPENAAAERLGMVTGRAEAWRTGTVPEGGLHDWDMARCYCTIARQCEVPVQHRMTVPKLTTEQYHGWRKLGAVLAHVTVEQDEPMAGALEAPGFRWPVGVFEAWLWDPEIDLLLTEGARVTFHESRRYFTAPALRAWAEWTLGELTPETQTVPPIVALWVKSQSRSLIGRFGMRYHSWEEHPDGNGLSITGLSVEGGPGRPNRTILHAAGKAWAELPRTDGDDCVPSITGWIMSEARVRLWHAMRAVGLEHLWHVDTDGLLVDREGSERLRAHTVSNPGHGWVSKGFHVLGEVRGTRNYTLGRETKIAGVPHAAERTGEATWKGEQWQGMREGLRRGQPDRVIVRNTVWTLTARDSRRVHLDDGTTRAYAPGEYAHVLTENRPSVVASRSVSS